MLPSRFRPAVFLIVFLCVLHESPSAFGDETVLCISGRTKHQIVIPDTCPNRAAEYSVSAAAELIRKVFAASGAELETVRESERNPGKYGIFLGPTRFAASHGVESIRLKKGELRHKSVGKNIIIAGCDLPDPVFLRGISTGRSGVRRNFSTVMREPAFSVRSLTGWKSFRIP